MVTSDAGNSWSLALTPQWMGYLPVISAARLGAQVTPAAYQRRKTVPCAARRSRLGVGHSLRPLKPTSPQPRSSARMTTMLGGRSALQAAGVQMNVIRMQVLRRRIGLWTLVKCSGGQSGLRDFIIRPAARPNYPSVSTFRPFSPTHAVMLLAFVAATALVVLLRRPHLRRRGPGLPPGLERFPHRRRGVAGLPGGGAPVRHRDGPELRLRRPLQARPADAGGQAGPLAGAGGGDDGSGGGRAAAVD